MSRATRDMDIRKRSGGNLITKVSFLQREKKINLSRSRNDKTYFRITCDNEYFSHFLILYQKSFSILGAAIVNFGFFCAKAT